MKFDKDPLYSIFEKHLNSSLMDDQSCSDTLIDQVVKSYLEVMIKLGHACGRIQEYIERDVREEATNMLRKRIYGHFDLKDYRQKQSDSRKKGNS